MAKTRSKADKLAALRDERQKQIDLYKRLPNQKDGAAQEVAARIHTIDKDIAQVSTEKPAPKGTPVWVWVLVAVAAGGLAWAGTFYYGGMVNG